MNRIQNRGRIELKWFIQRLKKIASGKGDPPVQPQDSEWTPFLSKLLLLEEPRCGINHNGLCLKDMSSSNLRFVHSKRMREKITGI